MQKYPCPEAGTQVAHKCSEYQDLLGICDGVTDQKSQWPERDHLNTGRPWEGRPGGGSPGGTGEGKLAGPGAPALVLPKWCVIRFTMNLDHFNVSPLDGQVALESESPD